MDGIFGKYISMRSSHRNTFQVALRHTQNREGTVGKAVMLSNMDFEPDWTVSVKYKFLYKRDTVHKETLKRHEGVTIPYAG